MTIDFKVNGTDVSIDVDPLTPLLEVLRNDLELNGPNSVVDSLNVAPVPFCWTGPLCVPVSCLCNLLRAKT